MSSPVVKWRNPREARKSVPGKVGFGRFGGIEISTLARWVILLVFMVLVIIILVQIRGAGDDNISSLCERTGGLMGC